MNLGELRKLTEHLSDDVEIITASDNFEMGNAWVKARGIRLVKVEKKIENFRDAFDNTPYSSEVYVPSENGKEALKI